jgi:hypothetical protein
MKHHVRSVASLRKLAALAGVGSLAVACVVAPDREAVGEATGAATSYSALPPATPAAWGAADVANAYQIPVSQASSATIAIINQLPLNAWDDPSFDSDLAIYRSAYGLPPCTETNGCLTKVNENGATSPLAGLNPNTNYPWPVSISSETYAAALDMASATCPSCKLLVIDMLGPANQDVANALSTAASRGAKVAIYAGQSTGTLAGPVDVGAYAASVGVSLFVAPNGSWDTTGAPVENPASSSSVFTVGCTSLGTNGAYNVRNGWTESATSACGAYAACTTAAKPSWQHDTGCSGRTIVDLAAVGGPVWTFNSAENDPGWVAQTNPVVATAIAAGIFAQAGKAGAASSYPYLNTSLFNDVTSGADGTCSGYMCNAQAGYDALTGVGSPNGAALLGGASQSMVTLGTVSRVTIAPSQNLVDVEVDDSATGWPNPAAVTMSISNLPPGVTATWVQSQGYIPPVSGIKGAFQLTASSSAQVGAQRTVVVTGTSGSVSYSTTFELSVEGTCVPATCAKGQCGTIQTGCSSTLYCGACSTGGLTCTGGTHNCGGYCARICE